MKNVLWFIKATLGLCGYYMFAQFLPLSHWPIVGKPSTRIREYFARMLLKRCGNDVIIERRAIFGSGRNLCLGHHSVLGAYYWMDGPITIGNDALIAPQVKIYRSNHVYNDPNIPIRCQGVTPAVSLEIGDDVWVGYGVVILPSCRKIGKGAIIAACSVLTKDVPDYAIFGGNPAKFVKWRKEPTPLIL